MTKVVLLRHGQALSNLDGGQVWIKDAVLTDLGKQQCSMLQKQIESLNVDHILVSPLLRAMQTCHIALSPRWKTQKAVIHPLLQETSHFPSDTPTASPQNKELLSELLPNAAECFDWSLLESKDDWYSNNGIYTNSVDVLVERAELALQHISTLSGTVVIVSHGAFIRYLLGKLPDLSATRTPGYYYNNCEARSYSLQDGKLVNEEIL